MLAKRGSTLIEALLGLFLMVLITPIFVQVLSLLLNYPDSFVKRQNDIGFIQLRRILSLGHSHLVSNESLCMNYRDEMTCFDQYEDKLRQYPGTQYYLIGLDYINFKKVDNWIIIVVETNDKIMEYGLLYVE